MKITKQLLSFIMIVCFISMNVLTYVPINVAAETTESEENNLETVQVEIGKNYNVQLVTEIKTATIQIPKNKIIVATAQTENQFVVEIGTELITLSSEQVVVIEENSKVQKTTVSTIATTKSFKVYEAANTTNVLLSGLKATTFNVVGYMNGMYEVAIGNGVGYLPASNAVSYKYATVKKDTNLLGNDYKKVIATLKKSSTVYSVTRTNNVEYYQIKWINGQQAFIHANDLAFQTTGTASAIKSSILKLQLPAKTVIYGNTTSNQVIGAITTSTVVQVVGQTNAYYEVQFAGQSGFIKKQATYSAKFIKNGSLYDSSKKVVGAVTKSDKNFIVSPTTDIHKFSLTIGSTTYLVDASVIELTTKVFNSQKAVRKEIIQLNAKTKIYTDSTLKTVAITLNNQTRTKVLDITSNAYKVQIGNTVGYVAISSTSGQFMAKLEEKASLYSDLKKTKLVAKNSVNTINYVVSTTKDKNTFILSVGNQKYYVDYGDLTFVNKGITNLKTPRTDTITTKANYILYKDASNNTPILTGGIANQKLVIQGVKGQYYIVHIGNTKAYLPAKFASGKEVNKEIGETATLYKYVNQKYIAVGTVATSYTFKASSTTSKYYTFKKDGETFAVLKTATVSSNKPVSLKAKATATYKVTLYAERNAAVYDASGTKIGTINKNQTIHLKGISNKNEAIVDFMGQQAYMKFTDLYHKNIVEGASNISHGKMSYYVKVFSLLYPEFTKRETIGYSVEGRAIHALRVGNGKKEILMDGSFHAREHMTTNVLLEMIDNYSYAYKNNSLFDGHNVKSLLDKTSIWFIPMINPDGVMLVQQGISALKNPENIKIAKKYARNGSYKHWKANARGVDLNRNFDGVGYEKMSKIKGYQNYVGPYALSEPEAKAFYDFVNKHNFKTNVSYHSSGSIIFWGGMQNAKELERDRKLVNQFAKATGYSPIKPKGVAYNLRYGSSNSTSWVIVEKRIPAITMEIATYQGEKPVALSQWASIWKKNKSIGLIAAKEAASR